MCLAPVHSVVYTLSKDMLCVTKTWGTLPYRIPPSCYCFSGNVPVKCYHFSCFYVNRSQTCSGQAGSARHVPLSTAGSTQTKKSLWSLVSALVPSISPPLADGKLPNSNGLYQHSFHRYRSHWQTESFRTLTAWYQLSFHWYRSHWQTESFRTLTAWYQHLWDRSLDENGWCIGERFGVSVHWFPR